MEDSEKMAIASWIVIPSSGNIMKSIKSWRKLDQFQHKLHLSPDEEVEKKRLQKVKLAGKDKIMEILGRHRQNSA